MACAESLLPIQYELASYGDLLLSVLDSWQKKTLKEQQRSRSCALVRKRTVVRWCFHCINKCFHKSQLLKATPETSGVIESSSEVVHQSSHWSSLQNLHLHFASCVGYHDNLPERKHHSPREILGLWWNRLPRKSCGCPSLEVFKARPDGALSNLVYSGGRPYPQQGCWNWMTFTVPSKPFIITSFGVQRLPFPISKRWSTAFPCYDMKQLQQ